jgi:hypothetical protein
MMSHHPHVSAEDFAGLFGLGRAALPVRASRLIGSHDLTYHHVEAAERDEVILAILRRLASDMPVSGPARQERWESGWAENLRDFVAARYDVRALVPKYYQSGNNNIMRWKGRYVRPLVPGFEVRFLDVLREIIAGLYLRVRLRAGTQPCCFCRSAPDKEVVWLGLG